MASKSSLRFCWRSVNPSRSTSLQPPSVTIPIKQIDSRSFKDEIISRCSFVRRNNRTNPAGGTRLPIGAMISDLQKEKEWISLCTTNPDADYGLVWIQTDQNCHNALALCEQTFDGARRCAGVEWTGCAQFVASVIVLKHPLLRLLNRQGHPRLLRFDFEWRNQLLPWSKSH